jgi:hypothetical protein
MTKKVFECKVCHGIKFDSVTLPMKKGYYKTIRYKCRRCARLYFPKDAEGMIVK